MGFVRLDHSKRGPASKIANLDFSPLGTAINGNPRQLMKSNRCQAESCQKVMKRQSKNKYIFQRQKKHYYKSADVALEICNNNKNNQHKITPKF